MTRNLGKTHLRCRRRRGDPMGDYDRLPAHLRAWLAGAALPWRPRSVRRAYAKALARTGDPDTALAELDRLQAVRLAQPSTAPASSVQKYSGGGAHATGAATPIPARNSAPHH